MTTAPQPADNSANHSSKQEAASVASPTLTWQEQLIIIRKKLAEHTNDTTGKILRYSRRSENGKISN